MDKKHKSIYGKFEPVLFVIIILLLILYPVSLLYKHNEFKQNTDPKDVYVTVIDKHIHKVGKFDYYFVIVTDEKYQFKLATKWNTYRKIDVGQTLKLTVRYDKQTDEPVNEQKLKYAEQ